MRRFPAHSGRRRASTDPGSFIQAAAWLLTVCIAIGAPVLALGNFLPVPGTPLKNVRSVTMMGAIGLVSVHKGVMIYDFSDPSSPILISELELPDRFPEFAWGKYDIAVRDSLAFVPSMYVGFYVVNIADLSVPYLVSETNLPGSGRSLTLYGNYVYIGATIDHRGYVVDVTDIHNLLVVDSLDHPAKPLFDALRVDSFLYTASGSVNVVDISDPAHPVPMGILPGVASSQALARKGNILYVVCEAPPFIGGTSGVTCIDISDPLNPQFLGRLLSPAGHEQDVLEQGGRVWVSADLHGLYTVDVTNPIAPVAEWCLSTASPAPCTVNGPPNLAGLTLYGGYIFCGGWDAGLLAIPLDVRGELSGDGAVTSSDIIHLVNHVLKSGPPPFSATQADTDCSSTLTSADVILLVNYIFKGSSQPLCP